ncbi:MAG TPA: alpha-mannosidase [Terriglobales bacterium]|nr:alpha-mannosidase [Terriglobales bacterium]
MRNTILRCAPGLLLLAALPALALPPQAAGAPNAARDWKPIVARFDAITTIPLPEWRFHAVDGTPGEAEETDDTSWQSYQTRKEWTTGSAWLRRTVELPALLHGYDLRGARLLLHIDLEGETTPRVAVYVNGRQVAEGEDLDTALISPSVEPGTKLLLAIRVQVLPGKTVLRRSQLDFQPAPGRPDPRMLLEECQSADLVIRGVAEQQAEREAYVDSALAAVDWAALERGDQAGFDQSLRAAQAKLQPLDAWLKSFTIHATGNTHIDMAWLWPASETVDVVRNTFSSALELMQEYPDFTFTMSTAQAYAWMEEKYPSLFQQIQERVKEGRWEPIGGMWVEPDLNIPDGESLVRQILIGKRYFKEKLGVDIRTGWNPDSFGYNWQLPQIYKKSGFDFFVTQKIYWNETTKFPYSVFWWESPDGTRILTYFPHDYANPLEPVRMADHLGEFQRKAHYPEMMFLYGVGDHGGGPTREMLETARRWQQPGAIYPRLELGKAQPYLDQLAAAAPQANFPVWDSELYLEYHRGTFTTQAETKKANRRNEVLLLEAEKFSSLASLYGRPYPQADLTEAWKKVLFNQFHDIMAGSGIHALYVDAGRDHAEVRRTGRQELHEALGELAAHAATAGPGVPVVVFNPLSWTRTGVVEVEAQFDRAAPAVEVRAPSGEIMLSENGPLDPATHRASVRFVAQDVPALGYAVFHLVPVARAQLQPSPLVASVDTLENEFLRVRVDPATGCITSLFDKAHQREALPPGACGNLLQTFVDKPKAWDAWNIDADFEKQKWDLTQPEEVRLVESGPVRAVLRVVKKFQRSTFTQDITVYAHVPRVDVRMSADWHEQHILLKVAFPVGAHSDFATFEIPYGSIQRPTTRNTPAEQAQFEVPALRWADLSDAHGGLSLLNDCKYGYDATGNVLRLSLLRSPVWPDPTADQGFHRFTYSLYPHAGSWKDADTVHQGYELNTPLLAMAAAPHPGPLPAAFSFASLAPGNLVLTAVKKAEDDDGLIFRFYESAGRKTEARLRLPAGAERAWETNLMEKPERELSLHDGEVRLATGPYEIKCVKVMFAAPAQAAGPHPQP